MDDKFHRNRKVRDLRSRRGGMEALGVWAFWWSWCLDDPELTGTVPEADLPRADERSAKLLVEVGLWDRVEGGYRFHDFHEYNPTRGQIEEKRRADRERIAAKRSASRENVARDNEATNPRVASTRVPTRPDPTEERENARAPAAAEAAPLVASRETSASLLRRAYESRHMRAKACPPSWGAKNAQHLATLADWLDAFAPPDPEAVVAKLLDGFFADPWAREKAFPLGALAQDPSRYLGRLPGAEDPDFPEHKRIRPRKLEVVS